MFYFLKRAINYYKENFSLILFFNIFAFFSLLLIFFTSGTYIVGGAAFINNLNYVDLNSYYFAFILSILSIAFFSIYICFLSTSIKRKECIDHKILDYLLKNLKKHFYKIFTFYLLLFLLNILISYFFYDAIKNIFLAILNLTLLFVPIIIVLEDHDIPSAVYKSVRFTFKKWLNMLILIFLFCILILVNVYIETYLQIFFGDVVGYIFSILFLSNLIFPLLVISLIELYLEIYSISGLGKIY